MAGRIAGRGAGSGAGVVLSLGLGALWWWAVVRLAVTGPTPARWRERWPRGAGG